jgi:predicted Fe-S protein YdhL (DUF1289 family)
MSGGRPLRIADARSTDPAWLACAARALGGEQPVPSPCVNVCRMNAASGWCEGCWRSIDEIAAWSRLDEAARRAVWPVLVARRARGLAPATAHGVAPDPTHAAQPGTPDPR